MQYQASYQNLLSDSVKEEINKAINNVLEVKSVTRKIINQEPPVRSEVAGLKKLTENPIKVDQLRLLQFKPQIEQQVRFCLSREELDQLEQWGMDLDISPIEQAAQKLVDSEEHIFYHGLSEAGIKGLFDSLKTPVIKTKPDAESILAAVLKTGIVLRQNNINGPYKIIIGQDLLAHTAQIRGGSSLAAIIEEELGQDIEVSDHFKGAVVIQKNSPDIYYPVDQQMMLQVRDINSEQVVIDVSQKLSLEILNPYLAVKIELE